MIDPRPLFHPLDHLLVELLESLSEEQWQLPTVAKQWNVKDVASHLLDGNLRVLSIQRDKYFGEAPPQSSEFKDMVDWLNSLNHDWIKATKRLSPTVLTLLLKLTGDLVSDYYCSLNPDDKAIFSVAWAGEQESKNWMHVAREYTERWHHQQQIRDAVNDPTILGQEYYYPVLDTFFQALPYTFRDESAVPGTTVSVDVTGHTTGNWSIERKLDKWILCDSPASYPTTHVVIPGELAWKLFSKSIRPLEILNQVEIEGDIYYGKRTLEMVSVMA